MEQTSEVQSEFLQRTRWYIRLRWFLLSAITLPSLVSLYLGSGLTSQRVSSLIISAVVLGTNAVFYGLSKLRRSPVYYRRLAMVLLAFDTLFISYFIYSKGGIESRSELLYALPILMASSLFGRSGVYLTATASAVSYDFVIIANYFGIIHSPEALTHEYSNLTYVLNSMVFFTAVLLLVAVLVDFLTRLFIQKQKEAIAITDDLRRAQAIAKVGSWQWDMETHAVTWSEELYNIFGLPKGDPITIDKFMKQVNSEDREWASGIIARTLKTHKPFSMDYRVERPDGGKRFVHVEGKVVTDKQGNVTQLYGIVHDKTAERALETAKGDFVSLASHQLRTPASGVRMLLAMLRDGYVGTLTSQQLRTVSEAYDANERLLRIADDLLNVAKLESGRLVLNMQQIELCLWLKTVVDPQKLLARQQRQKLLVQIPTGTAYLLGDPERLAMVIDNLLSNARKYTPKGGTITVGLVPGRKVHKLLVADTGSGMTRAEIASLFGKFSRLDNQVSKDTEGTGLGLFLAKSIIDLHHGEIKVTSKPGYGSRFIISLPVKPL